MIPSLSIVIPVAPGEPAVRNLLSDLTLLHDIREILLVAPESDGPDLVAAIDSLPSEIPIRHINSPLGRARQMNLGAQEAHGDFLWFLHADTIITPLGWDALQHSLRDHPDDLHYFDLEFSREGPSLMRLNSWGVWLRSHWFQMPFGDQGFCLSRTRFHELGGYDESLAYGEDHAFVWTARTAGLKVRSTGVAIETSPRKYRERGWCRTTLGHFWRTWKQALPHYGRLLRKRWSS